MLLFWCCCDGGRGVDSRAAGCDCAGGRGFDCSTFGVDAFCGGRGFDGWLSAFDGVVDGFGDDITFGRLPFPFEVPVPAVGGRGTGRLAVAGVAGDAGVAGFAEPAGFADTGRILACGGRGTLCAGVTGCDCGVAEAAGDPGFEGCAEFGIAP